MKFATDQDRKKYFAERKRAQRARERGLKEATEHTARPDPDWVKTHPRYLQILFHKAMEEEGADDTNVREQIAGQCQLTGTEVAAMLNGSYVKPELPLYVEPRTMIINGTKEHVFERDGELFYWCNVDHRVTGGVSYVPLAVTETREMYESRIKLARGKALCGL